MDFPIGLSCFFLDVQGVVSVSFCGEKEDKMIDDVVRRSRSYRRFYQETAIGMDTLRELVDLSRHSPSAGNLQPLKYILSADAEKNALIFQHLVWAGYLKDWPGPEEGERPSAYIILLGDTEISKSVVWDHGISAQTIILGAASRGFGGCMIGTINKEKLRSDLNIPSRYEILLALALGKPKEKDVIDIVGADGDIKYWRDEENVHHVPKRPLDEIIIG